jgi:hypothetical protein
MNYDAVHTRENTSPTPPSLTLPLLTTTSNQNNPTPSTNTLPKHNTTNMDKIKEKLHIGSSRRKSQPENDATLGSSSTGHGVGTIEGTFCP